VYKFYETIRDFGEEIMGTISHLRDVTLFAPSNAALEDPSVKQILQDKKRVKEILNLHYVKERLPLEKIQDKSFSQVSPLPSSPRATRIRSSQRSRNLAILARSSVDRFRLFRVVSFPSRYMCACTPESLNTATYSSRDLSRTTFSPLRASTLTWLASDDDSATPVMPRLLTQFLFVSKVKELTGRQHTRGNYSFIQLSVCFSLSPPPSLSLSLFLSLFLCSLSFCSKSYCESSVCIHLHCNRFRAFLSSFLVFLFIRLLSFFRLSLSFVSPLFFFSLLFSSLFSGVERIVRARNGRAGQHCQR